MLRSATALVQTESELFDGRFQILFPLGRGKYTVTYKVRSLDATLRNIDLALKVWNPPADEFTTEQNPIRYEALSLLSTRAKNILHLIDFVESERGSYLVTEFVDGVALSSELEKRQRGFSLADGVRIAVQLVDALEVVHHAGLVHCNVRPEKIFYREDGSIVLGGFSRASGIEELKRSAQHDDALSDDMYAAPESIRDGEYTYATDLFSVGIVLYQILTKQLPFSGRTAGERYQAKLGERWMPLSYYVGITNLPLERCIERLLSSNPARRYESCKELKATLTEILESLPKMTDEPVEPAITASPKRVRVRETLNLGSQLRSELQEEAASVVSHQEEQQRLFSPVARATSRSSRAPLFAVLFVASIISSFIIGTFALGYHGSPKSSDAETPIARPLLGASSVKKIEEPTSTKPSLPQFTHELSLQKIPNIPSEIRVHVGSAVTNVRMLSVVDGRQLNVPLRLAPADGSFWGKFPTPQRLVTYRLEFTMDGAIVLSDEYIENVATSVAALPRPAVVDQLASTNSELSDQLKQLDELRDIYSYSLNAARRLSK